MIRVSHIATVLLSGVLLATLLGCTVAESTAATVEASAEAIGPAECAACGMVVREQPAPRGQVVHRDGTRKHFCAVGDLVIYLEEPSPHGSVTHIFFEYFEPQTPIAEMGTAPRPWLKADEGAYIIAPDRQGIMGTPVLVYRGVDGHATNEKRLTWPELRRRLLSGM
ncbi:Nitrous oxide reductase accessory protein NosL [Sulfidibacter corallicola]|uniref:Nitrous oxide reductase accessory protein NosL n=1 Tax=Sulfidibacter corallicola TaxID=2818388 RepID=A0A8A4TMX7_SULCO|nr:nitrous oxide reductase accessory protein NosL [Sulfidibacter corallicola]QTD50452.1 nitrous oxide reductase accessory protein NosL [Sulfidibacter corallicola]